MSDKNHYTTWEELLEEYFFARNLRAATEWSYAKVVKGFLKFTGADITPSMVTHHEVLRWRRHVLREKQQSAQTWNNKIAHLRALSITMLWKVVYCLRAKTLLTIALYSGTERKSGL